MYLENLHSHTIRSDGRQNYAEVLNDSKRLGIGTVAFTDHDIPMGRENFEVTSTEGVRVISGIEISSGLPKEFGGGHHSKFHIVGLFVDPADIGLADHGQRVLQDRRERTRKTVLALEDAGFAITFEEVETESVGGIMGYPHIVRAMMRKPENVAQIEFYRNRMEIEAEHDPEVGRNYEAMMNAGPSQYPYTLFFHHQAFVRGIVQQSGRQPDMDASVALIRNAGGVALLAHYYSVSDIIGPDLLEKFIISKRLDGLEIIFGLFEFMPGSKESKEKERKQVREIAMRTGCMVGGGADSHRREDLELYAAVAELSGPSIGMYDELIRKTGL